MDLTSYFSIFFFFSGLCFITMGMVGRFRISKISSKLVPELSFYDYIDLMPLSIMYYNSIIILGVPFFCLGLSITYSMEVFAINSAICIPFFIYTNIYHRKSQNKLKAKGLNLKTIFYRLKNMELYKVEKQLKKRKIPHRVQSATNRDWEHANGRKKVA